MDKNSLGKKSQLHMASIKRMTNEHPTNRYLNNIDDNMQNPKIMSVFNYDNNVEISACLILNMKQQLPRHNISVQSRFPASIFRKHKR